jgi:hypothetical protein
MIKRFTMSLGVAAFLSALAPSADAQSTIYAPYSCVGNCVVQDGCTRAFLFNGQMMFHNETGQESPGAFTGPNRVTAFAWGLEGDIYPDMIIWHYPGRREHARWVKNNACPPPL